MRQLRLPFSSAFASAAVASAALTLLLLASTASAQSWRPVASMADERLVFQMTSLENNTALAVGGWNNAGNANTSCEIYDPATGTWSSTGSLRVGRAEFQMLTLSDHRIVVLGGQVGSTYDLAQTNAVEIYDPSTGLWSDGGTLQIGRQNFAAVLLNDGRILVMGGLAGGYNRNFLNECEIYDPATQTSQLVAPMHYHRNYFDATRLSDGRVLASGGRDGGGNSVYFNTVEVYDPTTDTWTEIDPMLQQRCKGVLVTFSDGSVLAAGGRNTATSSATGSELLDSNGTWHSTDPLKLPCHWSADVMLPAERYLMTGGGIGGDWLGTGFDNVTTSTCEWYDRMNERWYYAPQMNVARDKHQAVYLRQTLNDSLPHDLVLVAGGLLSSHTDSLHSLGITATAEVLDVSQEAIAMYKKGQAGAASVHRPASANELSLTVNGGMGSTPTARLTAPAGTELSLEIFSANGSRIESAQMVMQQTSADITLAHLENGLYFLQLRDVRTGQVVTTRAAVLK